MKIKFLIILLAMTAFSAISPKAAQAQASDPFLGQITYVPYTFCPRGWAETNGQILSIAQNTALFSLLGTTYGGDGRTTFALPDLRGRAPLHVGQGSGLSNHNLGETGGAENVTLSVSQLPAHSHALLASSNHATQTDPTNQVLAASGSYRPANPDTTLNPQSIGVTGGSQPVSIMSPYLVMRACIAMQGVYPSRN